MLSVPCGYSGCSTATLSAMIQISLCVHVRARVFARARVCVRCVHMRCVHVRCVHVRAHVCVHVCLRARARVCAHVCACECARVCARVRAPIGCPYLLLEYPRVPPRPA